MKTVYHSHPRLQRFTKKLRSAKSPNHIYDVSHQRLSLWCLKKNLSGGKNVSFSENSAYVLNEWSLSTQTSRPQLDMQYMHTYASQVSLLAFSLFYFLTGYPKIWLKLCDAYEKKKIRLSNINFLVLITLVFMNSFMIDVPIIQKPVYCFVEQINGLISL